ncbi:STAS-like domain-containing protein [Achromobacter sp.]|uniref:STAS-like domain-containing protein n=1 Tax=Achromobacter sp. TaxID=134375 RepID=UPI0028A74F77|nr:DUF4325 domain-containing protein [Achromobacter sp.]
MDDVALSGPLQERRHISRQAAASLLRRLVDSGVLVEGKSKRPKTYEPKLYPALLMDVPLEGLEEHVLWHDHVEPILSRYASKEALRIWSYGFTEMVNNAIDHSQGTNVKVYLSVSAIHAFCQIRDNGEGVFRRITRLCNLPDERLAILELSKGKLTTDPSRHSGEGLFFTSRALDWFSLDSYGLAFSHHEDGGKFDDWLVELDSGADDDGTQVFMQLNHQTPRTLDEVFAAFASPDEMGFDKTRVPVRLAKMGLESLVSRSQAVRLLARVDRFKSVMLDFAGVETIGQAFADQIFRVFANEHPEVELLATNTNPQVHGMISRARSNRAAGHGAP